MWGGCDTFEQDYTRIAARHAAATAAAAAAATAAASTAASASTASTAASAAGPPIVFSAELGCDYHAPTLTPNHNPNPSPNPNPNPNPNPDPQPRPLTRCDYHVPTPPGCAAIPAPPAWAATTPLHAVCHTGLEPQTSRPQAGVLLTRLSLALDRT